MPFHTQGSLQLEMLAMVHRLQITREGMEFSCQSLVVCVILGLKYHLSTTEKYSRNESREGRSALNLIDMSILSCYTYYQSKNGLRKQQPLSTFLHMRKGAQRTEFVYGLRNK